MKEQFKIEVFRNGEWVHQDSTDDIMDAYMLASSLCQQTPEDSIRIIYPSGFEDDVSNQDGYSPIFGFIFVALNIMAWILFLGWLYFQWK